MGQAAAKLPNAGNDRRRICRRRSNAGLPPQRFWTRIASWVWRGPKPLGRKAPAKRSCSLAKLRSRRPAVKRQGRAPSMLNCAASRRCSFKRSRGGAFPESCGKVHRRPWSLRCSCSCKLPRPIFATALAWRTLPIRSGSRVSRSTDIAEPSEAEGKTRVGPNSKPCRPNPSSGPSSTGWFKPALSCCSSQL